MAGIKEIRITAQNAFKVFSASDIRAHINFLSALRNIFFSLQTFQTLYLRMILILSLFHL